ncbi:MAG: type II secretion system protein [Phycisphaeraceae bacterium]|nr:type II secretion system protein [Phycisphaeraceae bacterium]
MLRRGFTMVEMVMVIGVLLVLVGLLLPAVQRSMIEARRTRSLVQCRQNLTLITAYANDYKDVYPLASESIYLSTRDWYKPIVEWGGAERARQLDLYSGESGFMFSPITFSLTMAVVRDADEMIPGHVPPGNSTPSRAVRQSEVLWPSRKGIVLQYALPYEKRERMAQDAVMHFCCTHPARPAPIGFGDGSVAAYRWTDLTEGDMQIEEGVGYPVMSTWYGYRGKDRP